MALGAIAADAVAGLAGADAAVLVGGGDFERTEAPLDPGAIDPAAVHLASGNPGRALDRVGHGRTDAPADLAAKREDGGRSQRKAELGALAGDCIAVALQPPGGLLQ